MSFSVSANPDITDNITYYLKNKGVDKLFFVGDLKWSVVNNDNAGWLICDGRSLLRASYPDLFNVIGTQFGAQNGDSFNLPDCRSRVLGAIGRGNGLSNRTTGDSVGEESHVLTINEMPSHNHSIDTPPPGANTISTGNTSTIGNHTHGVTDPGHAHGYTRPSNANISGAGLITFQASSTGDTTSLNTTGVSINAAGSHNHQINSNGNDRPHNNMQPTLFIGNVFVYAGYQYIQYP